jgi:hypothetical protein
MEKNNPTDTSLSVIVDSSSTFDHNKFIRRPCKIHFQATRVQGIPAA